MPTYNRTCSNQKPHGAHGSCGGVLPEEKNVRCCPKESYHKAHAWAPAFGGGVLAWCPGVKWQTLTQAVQEADSWVDFAKRETISDVDAEQADWESDEEEPALLRDERGVYGQPQGEQAQSELRHWGYEQFYPEWTI